MKKIGLTGYFGMGNYGDDIFLMTAFAGANIYWTNYKSCIVGCEYSGFDAAYKKLPFISDAILSSKNRLGSIARMLNYAFNYSTNDKIVFSGGSIFTNAGFDSMALAFFMNNNKRGYFSAIGVSIGPFKNAADELSVIKRLRQFEYISVRDKLSFDRLMSYGLGCKIVQAADLAGATPYFFPTISHTKDNTPLNPNVLTIGFTPAYLESCPDNGLSYCNLFIDLLKKIKNNIRIKVVIVSLNDIQDLKFCKLVSDYINFSFDNVESTIVRSSYAFPQWKTIASLDVYFTARLHGAITAYMSNTPFFLFEHHEKCTEFLDFIKKPEEERVPLRFLEKCDLQTVLSKIIDSDLKNLLDTKIYSSYSLINFTESPLAVC